MTSYYQNYRRRGGGGGGGGQLGMLRAILGATGLSNAGENPYFETAPGDIPFDQSVDAGALAAQPYRTPGFWQKIAGNQAQGYNEAYRNKLLEGNAEIKIGDAKLKAEDKRLTAAFKELEDDKLTTDFTGIEGGMTPNRFRYILGDRAKNMGIPASEQAVTEAEQATEILKQTFGSRLPAARLKALGEETQAHITAQHLGREQLRVNDQEDLLDRALGLQPTLQQREFNKSRFFGHPSARMWDADTGYFVNPPASTGGFGDVGIGPQPIGIHPNTGRPIYPTVQPAPAKPLDPASGNSKPQSAATVQPLMPTFGMGESIGNTMGDFPWVHQMLQGAGEAVNIGGEYLKSVGAGAGVLKDAVMSTPQAIGDFGKGFIDGFRLKTGELEAERQRRILEEMMRQPRPGLTPRP